MADLATLIVDWTCPACRYSTGLRFNAVQRGPGVAFVLEDGSHEAVRHHLSRHIADIKQAWRTMESTLGALGYAMDVTVSPGVDPDRMDKVSRFCLCGHPESRHKDRRDEYVCCQVANCGCLAFSEDTGEPDPDPWGTDGR